MPDPSTAPVFSRRRRRRLAMLLLLGLGVPAGLIGLALAVWGIDAHRVAAGLTRAGPWLALWRLTLVGVLISAWGPLIAWLGKRWGLTPAQVRALQQHRWSLAVALLAAELGLVQNVLGRWLERL